MRQLVKHPDFGQRERAAQQVFLERSNLASVEAVKAANGLDRIKLSEVWGRKGCGCHAGSVSN